MRQYFPFTDYDFYGYLSCGVVFLFSCDFFLSGSVYFFQENWNFAEIALMIVLCYVSGQIIAHIASIILEDLLAKVILLSPTEILLSERQAGFKILIGKLVGDYYSPLPFAISKKIRARIKKGLKSTEMKSQYDCNSIFQIAFVVARQNPDTRERIDNFRNQYGFHRNMAISSLVASMLFYLKFHDTLTADLVTRNWAYFFLIISIGMTCRFLKFYRHFTKEVLQAYAYPSK